MTTNEEILRHMYTPPTIDIKVEDLRAVIPEYKTDEACGLDLSVVLEHSYFLQPGERKLFETGLKIKIPSGYVGFVCPRSGMAANKGVTVINSPGVIDPDYLGLAKVALINESFQTVEIKPGERVAQLVVIRQDRLQVRVVSDLGPMTTRGEGGFGSTGT